MTQMRFAAFLLTSLIISILVFLCSLMQIIIYAVQQGYLTNTAALVGAYLAGFVSPILLFLKFTAMPEPSNDVLNTSMSKALSAVWGTL
jgi:hypothetical protein